jgi:hypothetical protein
MTRETDNHGGNCEVQIAIKGLLISGRIVPELGRSRANGMFVGGGGGRQVSLCSFSDVM